MRRSRAEQCPPPPGRATRRWRPLRRPGRSGRLLSWTQCLFVIFARPFPSPPASLAPADVRAPRARADARASAQPGHAHAHSSRAGGRWRELAHAHARRARARARPPAQAGGEGSVGLTFHIVGRSLWRSDLGVDPALDLGLEALDGWIQAVGERVDETIRLKPGHTFYVWVMDEECFNYKRNMSVLWLYYVSIMYILLPFWVDWLGCVKHFQISSTGIFIMYMLCNLYCELCTYYEYS